MQIACFKSKSLLTVIIIGIMDIPGRWLREPDIDTYDKNCCNEGNKNDLNRFIEMIINKS